MDSLATLLRALRAARACAPSNWRSDSNGCAAGETPEAARLAALLELIERDATGIWWYGRCRRPGLDPARLGQPALHAAIEARAQGGQTVHLLDLTHDLRVPVVAAILFQGEQLLGLGFGCKLTLGAAAVSAYLELCQMELSIALAGQRASAEDEQLLRWMKGITPSSHPYLTPAGSSTTDAAESRNSTTWCSACDRWGFTPTRSICSAPISGFPRFGCSCRACATSSRDWVIGDW